MAFIYVITNQINNKQYVGKTTKSIKKRFQEHISDSRKERCEKRPLYDAMNKYGIENFSIEQLEECSSDIVSEREQYWIEKLDTFYNGYNATFGGDGIILYDYKQISDKYIELQNQRETAKFFNCDVETVRKACLEYDIDIKTSQEISKEQCGIKVFCQELNCIFNSWHEAARYLFNNGYTTNKSESSIGKNIVRSCKDNNHKATAYKMHWRYT